MVQFGMTWDVCLEGPSGRLVRRLGSHSALDRRWTSEEEQRFPWLTSISPYDENVFNFRQSRHLLRELSLLLDETIDERARTELEELKGWLEALPDRHLYIRMTGD